MYHMEISLLLGKEHLSNTPARFYSEALGWTPGLCPYFPYLGRGPEQMSKRKGDTSVEQYREKGYLPEAVVSFLALWVGLPEGEEEIFQPKNWCPNLV